MEPVSALACSLVTLSSLHFHSVAAPRTHDPGTGLPICTVPGWRVSQQVVPDESQGAIIAWYDSRGEERGTSLDVYVQRINAAGNLMWDAEGVPLCDAPGEQYNVTLVPDGLGGAIAAWTDRRSPALDQPFAQRIDSRGRPLWTPNGVCVAPEGEGVTPIIAPDGTGGVFVVWESFVGYGLTVSCQHVDASGNPAWGPAGLAICTVQGPLHGPRLASDGADGAFFVWNDERVGSRVYMQHVRGDGTTMFPENGARISPVESIQRRASIVSDGAGGIIVTWKDNRGRPQDSFGVFAQRVSGAGDLEWNPNGIQLSPNALTDEGYPAIASDPSGAIVVWHDRHAGPWDILAQRLNMSGHIMWGSDGVTLCDADGEQTYASVISDHRGGAILAWSDARSTDPGYYAQHVDVLGNVLWGTTGALVTTQELPGFFWPVIASDGRDGAFVVWTVFGPGIVDTPIYARRLLPRGPAPRADPATWPASRFSRSSPGSTIAQAKIDENGAPKGLVAVYDVSGRRIRELAPAHSWSDRSPIWDARDDQGNRVKPGLYFLRITLATGSVSISRVVLR